MTSSILALTVH